MTWKILATDPLADEGLSLLVEHPEFELVNKPGLTEDELLQAISDAHALLVRSGTKATAKAIQAGKKLRLIGRAGTGVDNIDIDAATKHGIVVMNTPGGNSVAAAEHTFALLLALMRQISPAHSELLSGQWTRKQHMGGQLQGRSLGLVGFGRIGREVARRARAFGMQVLVNDPFVSEALAVENEVRLVSREDVLKQSDVISLHVPLTKETRHMINQEVLQTMKPGAVVINCARGGLVDEDALLEALNDGTLGGAALDVFENEPPGDAPLLRHPRVLATPHLGASTQEAQRDVASQLVEQVIRYFTQGEVQNAVNMPSLSAEMYAQVKPYLDLGERLGSIAGQVLDAPYSKLEVVFRGEAAELPRSAVMASVLIGVLNAVDPHVANFVNAPLVAKELGIDVSDTTDADSGDYAALIEVRLRGETGSCDIAGAVTPSGKARLAGWQGMAVDAPPAGHMLALSNPDLPGVVGTIGTLLGQAGVNIANISWGRDSKTGIANTLINIDTPLPPKLLSAIQDHDHVLWARMVELP